MNWEPITPNIDDFRRTKPEAILNDGVLSLNRSACELLFDYTEFKYVEVFQTREKGNLYYGLRFYLHITDNSIPIYVKCGEKNDSGLYFNDMTVLSKMFGTDFNKVERHFDVLYLETDKVLVLIQN